MDYTFAVTFFGALFAIMNPITNLPVFLSLTEGGGPEIQRQTALKATLYSLVMGAIFAIGGRQILTLFGITVDDFRVAGGLVVLLIALNMLHGEKSSTHNGTPEEKNAYPAPESVAFYPLTFPIIMGPGTITTLIVFSHQIKGIPDMIAFAAVFGLLIAMLGLVFFNAPVLARYLSDTMRVIMSRLMGMILAAIAVAMIADGLKVLLPGLA